MKPLSSIDRHQPPTVGVLLEQQAACRRDGMRRSDRSGPRRPRPSSSPCGALREWFQYAHIGIGLRHACIEPLASSSSRGRFSISSSMRRASSSHEVRDQRRLHRRDASVALASATLRQRAFARRDELIGSVGEVHDVSVRLDDVGDRRADDRALAPPCTPASWSG